MPWEQQLLVQCLSQVEGDTELLRELLDMLEPLMDESAEAFRDAARREDREGAHAIAHSVKGMLANIGFFDLAERAYEIEQLSLEGRFSAALESLENLSRETFERVRGLTDALEEMRCES